MPEPDLLAASVEPLSARYDTALVDLDGVVYLDRQPVPHAAASLAVARGTGMRMMFVTNNASRRPKAVAELLASVGVDADESDVVTAAQASADLLAERLSAGAPVLVVGGPALAEELVRVGLRPVDSAADDPVAVVQGYADIVGWPLLAEACVAIRAGALWVASNTDATVPSPRGPLPGNGALVAALATALERRPDEVVGKPHPRLLHAAVARCGARRPLMIGDRLDTDIAGARSAGIDSLLVLTGVTTPADVLRAPAGARPTYLADDLRGLNTPHQPVTAVAGGTSCGEWTVRQGRGSLELSGAGTAVDALRALAGAAWGGEPPAMSPVRAQGDAAGSVLATLGLTGPW